MRFFEFHVDDDHIEKPYRDVSATTVWEGLRDSTSAHGIPHFNNARGWLKRGFWLFMSIVALSALIFHFYYIVTSFISRPVSVKIEILQNYEMTFPAVTICNMNPVKASAMGAISTASSPKRRKKRVYYFPYSSCDDQYVDPSTGICYGVKKTSGDDYSTGLSNCAARGGHLALLNDINQINFLKSIPSLFQSASEGRYWIYIQNKKWMGIYEPSFTYYENGDPPSDSCVRVEENHDWRSKSCDSSGMALCQKYAWCPYPVYTHGDGTTSCYVIIDKASTTTRDLAQTACTTLGYNFVEFPTKATYDHMLSTDVLNGTSMDYFWLDLKQVTAKMFTWEASALALPYISEWESSEPNLAYDCAFGLKSTGQWRTAQCNNAADVAHIMCEVNGLSDPPWYTTAPDTTALPETTTTVEHTTTLEPATTMEHTTTLEPATTVEQTTTKLPTTVASTTAKIASEPSIMTHEPTTTARLTTTEAPTLSTITARFTTSEATTMSTTTARLTTTETPTISTTTARLTTTEAQTISTTTARMPDTTPGKIEGSNFPERKATRESFQIEEKITEALAELEEAMKSEMGYQPWEFIVDCQYEGVTCSATLDFSHFYNPIHGNCYIFNSGWNASTPLMLSHRTGRRYGLQVTVNIGQDEYTDLVGGPSGARVVVHPPGLMPHPEEQGSLVRPGELASMGISKMIVNRLSQPYGVCTEETKDVTKDIFAEIYPVNYTRIGCFKTCYQRNVIEKCGCFDSYVPGKGAAFDHVTVPVCSIRNLAQDDCKYNITNQYIKGNLGCEKECPNACVDEFFQTDISTNVWPSNVHMNKVVKSLGDKIANLNINGTKEKYRDNLLQLEVYFEEFNFQQTTEFPAYTPQSFASDVGGILGLWLGFSMLSVFEFVEFGIDIIVLCTMWLFRDKSKKNKIMEAGSENKIDNTKGKLDASEEVRGASRIDVDFSGGDSQVAQGRPESKKNNRPQSRMRRPNSRRPKSGFPSPPPAYTASIQQLGMV